MPRSTRFIKSTSVNRANLSLLGLLAANIFDVNVANQTAETQGLREDNSGDDQMPPSSPKEEEGITQSADELSQSISAEEPSGSSISDEAFDYNLLAKIMKQMKAMRQAKYLQVKGMRIEIEKQLAKWAAHCATLEVNSETADALAKQVDQSVAELQAAIKDTTMDATAAAIKVKVGVEELTKARLAGLPKADSTDQEIIDQVNMTLKTSMESWVQELKEEESQLEPPQEDDLSGDLETLAEAEVNQAEAEATEAEPCAQSLAELTESANVSASSEIETVKAQPEIAVTA